MKFFMNEKLNIDLHIPVFERALAISNALPTIGYLKVLLHF